MAEAGTALEDAIKDLDTDETLDSNAPSDEDQQDDLQADDDQGDEDGTDGQSSEEEEEFEIALDGDDGSHPQDDNRGIRKRINKLNQKVEIERAGKTEAEEALEIERERVRLLQLALEQQGGKGSDANSPPDPKDFDDGVADAGYVKAFQEHIARGVLEQATQAQSQSIQSAQADNELEARQVAHYKRADTLKVKDYDETEDAAIAILGQDVTKEIIKSSDKSSELLYYLGKNPRVAEDIVSLVSTNPTKAVLQIGRLEAKLVARPKAKRNVAPNPDKDLTGGGAGGKKQARGPRGATFE